MKESFWRRALSYIKPVLIESADSEHNPFLRVVLRRGRYQLLTANAIYSYGDLYDNFSKAFRQINLEALPIQRVLILGLGLGSIPYMLEKLFHKNYTYTAVEIDPSVWRLAKRYGVSELRSPIQFELIDAQTYASFCTEQFDMICMDVFLDDMVPTELEQEDFLIHLKKMLTTEGILLFNKLAFHKKDKRQTEAFFQNHFKRIFTEGGYLDVHGNYILLNRMDVLR